MPRIDFEKFVGGKKTSREGRGPALAVAAAPLAMADVESAVRRLPALPALLHELMQELRSEDADIGRLEERIASDPSLTTRVLKMANSPFYVRASEVVDVRRAVLTLGFRTVSNLVMAAGLRSTIASSAHVPGFVANGIFLHSLASGLACGRLARGVPRLAAESHHLFVAGLLHDVGRVALTEFYVERRADLDHPKRRHLSPNVEAEVFGIDHQQVGRLVCERWGLPEELLAPISRHHEPIDALRDEPLTLAIAAVDSLLNRTGYARTEPMSDEGRTAAACDAIGLEPKELERRIADVAEEVSSIAGSFA